MIVDHEINLNAQNGLGFDNWTTSENRSISFRLFNPITYTERFITVKNF